jgi:hypothetical protein
MHELRNYDHTFVDFQKDGKIARRHSCPHLTQVVKRNGRHDNTKKLVTAGGHLMDTAVLVDSFLRCGVAACTTHRHIFLAEINSLKTWAMDTCNMCLEAKASEHVFVWVGILLKALSMASEHQSIRPQTEPQHFCAKSAAVCPRNVVTILLEQHHARHIYYALLAIPMTRSGPN